MARRRLHGETQKRRQKKRTRVLKLRETASRVQATQQPMAYEASPELEGQDLEFLEAMRDLSVRSMPGAGGLPVRRRAIERAHAAADQNNAAAFQAAMSALRVRALTEGSDEPRRSVRPPLPPEPQLREAAHPARVPTRPEPPGAPAHPPPAARPDAGEGSGTEFASDPEDRALMEQALREGIATLSAKFQGAPPPAPVRSKPRQTRAPEGDPDAELDLHGTTQEQAIRRVQGFLLTAHRQRLRRVLIITGRGLKSGEQGPVLRDAVTRWLERNGGPFVRDFHAAPARHGGAGALWIELR